MIEKSFKGEGGSANSSNFFLVTLTHLLQNSGRPYFWGMSELKGNDSGNMKWKLLPKISNFYQIHGVRINVDFAFAFYVEVDK